MFSYFHEATTPTKTIFYATLHSTVWPISARNHILCHPTQYCMIYKRKKPYFMPPYTVLYVLYMLEICRAGCFLSLRPKAFLLLASLFPLLGLKTGSYLILFHYFWKGFYLKKLVPAIFFSLGFPLCPEILQYTHYTVTLPVRRVFHCERYRIRTRDHCLRSLMRYQWATTSLFYHFGVLGRFLSKETGSCIFSLVGSPEKHHQKIISPITKLPICESWLAVLDRPHGIGVHSNSLNCRKSKHF